MSWTDEEIDDLFRDGASNQSFKYDNSYFSEIEGALPVNRKGKDFLWMGTALVFIAVLTTGYFVNTANDTSFAAPNNQLANLELNTTENTNEMDTPNEKEISTGDQNQSINKTELNSSNNELLNAQSAMSNTTLNSNTNTSTSWNNKSANAFNAGTTKVNQGVKTTSTNSMYAIATRNVGTPEGNEVNVSNTQTGVSNTNLAGNTELNGNLVNLRNDTEVSESKKSELQTSPITASLGLNAINPLDQQLNNNLAANAVAPPVLGELRPKSMLYVELNAGVSQSLITPSDFMSKSYGGGVGVETYLGDFNLTTGLNFKISHHDDLFLTRQGKVYGFGSSEGTNTYDFQKIYSLELPISLGYNFGRHNFNVGVRPSLVVGGQTKFQAFENNQLLRTSTINGLVDGGLMRVGVKPTFGFAFRVNQWTIGANVGIQLMESVNEEYIDGFNNQFPVDGQLYLRRTIRLRR